LEFVRSPAPRRPLCWYCSRLDIRDIRVAKRPQVSYTCGWNPVRAPRVDRCQFFLREPVLTTESSGPADGVLRARQADVESPHGPRALAGSLLPARRSRALLLGGFAMRLARAALAAVVLTVSTPLLAAPCAGFTDVDDSSPFCVNVEWMKNRGITLGFTPTLYGPNSPVTRLQMAAFMYWLGFQNAFLRDGNAFDAPAVLGTTDNQPLDVIVGNARALRFEPGNADNAPNLIGSYSPNVLHAAIRSVLATIAGSRPTQTAEVVR
jgi:hypothetical protein